MVPTPGEDDDALVLIGRRNVTETGDYMLQPEGTPFSLPLTVENLVPYSASPKRCALWQLDPGPRRVRFVADVPSKGDTCFPSVLKDSADGRAYTLYNYSSPLEGPDEPWFAAQEGETRIYRMSLRFGPSTR